ncbi:cysteine proteinase [Hortaea werneckii]|nr:cysteine proteinase [Hortaea werneckii]
MALRLAARDLAISLSHATRAGQGTEHTNSKHSLLPACGSVFELDAADPSNTLVLLQTVTLQQGRSTLCFATHPAFNLLRLPSHSLPCSEPPSGQGIAQISLAFAPVHTDWIYHPSFRLLALSSASDHLPNNSLNLMPCLLRTLPRAPQAAGLCSLSQPYARSSCWTFYSRGLDHNNSLLYRARVASGEQHSKRQSRPEYLPTYLLPTTAAAVAASTLCRSAASRPRRLSLSELPTTSSSSATSRNSASRATTTEPTSTTTSCYGGPLVGQREPSTNITTEYASADPVFQAKTAVRFGPRKYSHYRTIRGDGRCGWRAIAYGYFETLIHLGDSNKFFEEEARLRSLSNVLNEAGYDALLYEDFADSMFDTLRKVHNALQTGDAETILHEDFNDEALQNYIITYLKTLTSAWMKTKQSEYSPWLLGQTVSQYCDVSVMPIGAEIDNVSLSALKDVFLSKAGIALEVLYLDRTEGEEVNMHRFDPVNYHGGVTIGTIRLLYRPGHYDILYKAEDFPQPIPPMQTYLQYGSHMHDDPVGEVGCPDFMALIPGMSYANPHQAWMSNSSYGSDFFATPAPVNQCVPPPIPTPAPQTQPQPNRATANADATRDGDPVRTFAWQPQPRRLSKSTVWAIQAVSLGIRRRVRASNVTNAASDVNLQKTLHATCVRCGTHLGRHLASCSVPQPSHKRSGSLQLPPTVTSPLLHPANHRSDLRTLLRLLLIDSPVITDG